MTIRACARMAARGARLAWDRCRSLADRRRPVLLGGMVLGVAAAFLAPTLEVGYLSDDNISSLTPGTLLYVGQDLLTWTLGSIWRSIEGGRFYPLHWVAFQGVFWLFRDVVLYKAFILAMVLLDLALFVVFVGKVTGSTGLGCLAATLTTMLFQLRAWHDPILSFFGLLQLVVTGLLLSLIALDRFLDGRGRRWLVLSASLHLACLLLYENTYPFFVLHGLLIIHRREGWGSRLAAITPFAATTILCLFATLLVRGMASEGDGTYALNLEPGAVLSTLARQSGSALPLSYFAADPAGLFAGEKHPEALFGLLARPDVVAIVVATSALVLLILRGAHAGEIPARSRDKWVFPAAFAALLTLLPGLMISATERYQREVAPGNGYVSVYVQYFGVGWLLALAIWRLGSMLRGRRLVAVGMKATVTVSVGLVTGLTYHSNRLTAASLVARPGTEHFNVAASGMGGAAHDNRRNLEAALRAGLLDGVPEYATILPTSEYTWWYEGLYSILFYAANTSKVLTVVPPSAQDESSPSYDAHRKLLARHPVREEAAFVVRDVCLGPDAGFVVLARQDRRLDHSGDLRLFVRHPDLFRGGHIPAFLALGIATTPGRIQPYVGPGDQLHILRSGRDWGLFRVPAEVGHIDPGSLHLIFDPAEAARVVSTLERPSDAGQDRGRSDGATNAQVQGVLDDDPARDPAHVVGLQKAPDPAQGLGSPTPEAMAIRPVGPPVR